MILISKAFAVSIVTLQLHLVIGGELSKGTCECPSNDNKNIQLWKKSLDICRHLNLEPGWATCMAHYLGWVCSKVYHGLK